MYQALECCAADAIGAGGSWAAVMDSGLVNNLGELSRVCRGLAGSMHPGPLACQESGGSMQCDKRHTASCPRRMPNLPVSCSSPDGAGKYRKYSYGSLRDLLRVIRNKHNHFRCVAGPGL